MVIHSKARYDWMHLRLQDFKSIHEYNTVIFRITSQLKLCGETVSEIDMMEKTFSTFHPSNVLLQQQYREKGFKKYSELISHLFEAEQNNNLLLKNHENRPTGSEPLSEVNEVYAHHARRGKGRGPNCGRERGRDYGQERNSFPVVNHSSNKNHNQKKKRKDEKREATREGDFRCGGRGHYARDCRTPKHLVEIYQESLKNKEKNPKANFISENQVDITYLDV
ncbi:uncharacterized protein [Solanum lycopersicum]|uniref:uncharacterized protein n=1 Tax=Solanum lycopersicum TaxID=4081 RepID=UPI0037487CD5